MISHEDTDHDADAGTFMPEVLAWFNLSIASINGLNLWPD
jgi:hypothetical protein